MYTTRGHLARMNHVVQSRCLDAKIYWTLFYIVQMSLIITTQRRMAGSKLTTPNATIKQTESTDNTDQSSTIEESSTTEEPSTTKEPSVTEEPSATDPSSCSLSQRETVIGCSASCRASRNFTISSWTVPDGCSFSKKRHCRAGNTSSTLSPTSSCRVGAIRGTKFWDKQILHSGEWI